MAYDLWHKFQQMSSTHALPRSGQPPKITNHMKQSVIPEAKMNHWKPLDTIGKLITPNISASSMRAILQDVGLHWRQARKVVYLWKDQKESRKCWAKDHKDWMAEDWMHMIWSHECYVYIGDDWGMVWFTQSADEEFDENCVVPTFKQSALWVMIWACIMEGSKGPMVILDYPGGQGGGMIADRYQDQVLDKVFFDYYGQMSEERGQVVFQKDRASCHHAKTTIACLERNCIETFPHPSSSPNLSPIEPLWHQLKTLIQECSHPPMSLNELKSAVQEASNYGVGHSHTCQAYERQSFGSSAANGGHMKY